MTIKISSFLFLFLFSLNSAFASLLSPTQFLYSATNHDLVEDLLRDYSQQLQKKMRDMDINFLKKNIPQKAPTQRRFVSEGRQGCHGANSEQQLEQVALVEQQRLNQPNLLRQTISTWGCSSDLVLMKEIIEVRGTKPQPLSLQEIYAGQRKWGLQAGENYRLYQVETRFFSGISHKILSKKNGNKIVSTFSAFDQELLKITEQPLTTNNVEIKIELKKFDVSFSTGYSGPIKTKSDGSFWLKIISNQTNGHQNFFSSEHSQELSPRKFKTEFDTYIRDSINFSFNKPLQAYLVYMPSTESSALTSTSTRFRKEFDDILNLALSRDEFVGADFQRMKDFLFRTLKAMDGGQLEIKDSRPVD